MSILNKKIAGFDGKVWLLLIGGAVAVGLWWKGHIPDVPGAKPRAAIQRQQAGRRLKRGIPGQGA